MAYFCLDLGGTKSVAALYGDDGRVLGRARTGPGALSRGSDATLAAVAALWQQVSAIGPSMSQTDVVMGLAGIGLRDQLALVQAGMARFRSLRAVSDGYGALIAATGGRPGLMIAVGTGVAAMRLNPDGTCLYASGWGFPGGDLGGGAWIGLQATAALTRHLDATPGACAPMSDAFAQALMTVTGSTATQIMAWLTTGRAADYALLAPIVLAAAPRDPLANRLLERAAAELRDVAFGLQVKTSEPITLNGGLARSLLPYLCKIGPEQFWLLVEADPLEGLLLVGTGAAPEERLAPRPNLGFVDYQP